jgi:hypothetical protein
MLVAELAHAPFGAALADTFAPEQLKDSSELEGRFVEIARRELGVGRRRRGPLHQKFVQGVSGR